MRFQPDWFPVAAFYFALANAALVAVAGAALGLADTFVDDKKLEPIRCRVLAVVVTVVGANAAGAVLLGALRWVLS